MPLGRFTGRKNLPPNKNTFPVMKYFLDHLCLTARPLVKFQSSKLSASEQAGILGEEQIRRGRLRPKLPQ